MIKLKHVQAGFSLVETVAAIALASIAYLAILTLNSSNARTSASSRDQAIATKITQESAEALRTVRSGATNVKIGVGAYVGWNTAWNLFPTGWNGTPPPPANAVFTLRYDTAAGPTANQWLLEEAINGTPYYDVVGNTGFMRRVLVADDIPAGSGLKVFQVEVCWGAAPVASCFDPAMNNLRIVRQSVKLGQKTGFN